MNPALTRDVKPLFRAPVERTKLKWERQLAVAAAMLKASAPDQMTATTVVGVLGMDDADAFGELVQKIGDEYGLEARIRTQVGSFSVRFSRPVAVAAPY